MHPEPITERMCDSSNCQFGERVNRPHPAHIPASRCRVDSVDHQIPRKRPMDVPVFSPPCAL
jgi:hypothetical protein